MKIVDFSSGVKSSKNSRKMGVGGGGVPKEKTQKKRKEKNFRKERRQERGERLNDDRSDYNQCWRREVILRGRFL